ncbi:MAG: glycosyltransferase family 2 protein [Gammaproteobacteria bacterium]|nr:glycosyltransferase family 2 protein [Gammaproteobacteria bacterium]
MISWHDIIIISQWFFLIYFLAINSCYLMLNIFSTLYVRSYMPGKTLEELPQIYSGLELPISILVPAYNEEKSIASSIQSMLQLNYPLFEIIVINDESTDGTLRELIEKFSLVPFPEAYRAHLKTAAILGIYCSTRHPNLRVIDKRNGGKADALNAGINAARYPLFCAVDADSVLQRTSLQRIVRPFLEDHRVVAAGGTIRVGNGCKISGGFLQEIRLPSNPLALLQVVEYLRAFLFGRLGWSYIGGLLIISGAFGLFRKETVIAVGGYHIDTVGEDMELVLRIHRVLRKNKKAYRMVFLPDPVAWTEVPEDFRSLMNQRARWQRGLSESLIGNIGLLFSRNGGAPGWIAFPFMILFEWLGPVIEVSGYILMITLYWLGLLSVTAFLVFIFAAIGLSLLASFSSLLLEEVSFHMYKRPRHLALIMVTVIIENFGFRQLNSIWRLYGLIQWMVYRKRNWGAMKRKEHWEKG